jgi:radical SAM superfamily enzyme YgiQ (UPF0313 family)
MAKDPELLSLAARSGCQAMFVGLESLSRENLLAIGKAPNLGTDMGAAIRTIHKAGIEIIGSFVLGLDADDGGVFARTVAFAEQHKLVAAQFAVLTPFPGTAMRQQLEREGRILDHDWSHYTMSNVVFRPRHMTDLELRQGQRYAYARFYSVPSILRRSFTVRRKFIGRLLVNFSYRGIGCGKGLHHRLPGQRLPKPLRASGAP